MVACQWRDIVSQSNARRNAGTSRSASAYGDEVQRPDDPRAAVSNELITDSFSSHMPRGRRSWGKTSASITVIARSHVLFVSLLMFAASTVFL